MNYAGLDNFPTEISLPDDLSSPRAAASVNAALEGLANRTQFLNLRTAKLAANQTFTGINTFTNSIIADDTYVARLRRPAPVNLADVADQTITPAGGHFYRVPTTAAGSRIVRLGSAVNGDMIRIFHPRLATGGGVWKVRRVGAGVDILNFDNTGATFDTGAFADFIYDVTAWRFAGGAGPLVFGADV